MSTSEAAKTSFFKNKDNQELSLYLVLMIVVPIKKNYPYGHYMVTIPKHLTPNGILSLVKEWGQH